MSKKAKEYAHKYHLKVLEAIDQFGIYSYNDKGPQETMDVNSILDELRMLDNNLVADILELLIIKGDQEAALAEFLDEELS